MRPQSNQALQSDLLSVPSLTRAARRCVPAEARRSLVGVNNDPRGSKDRVKRVPLKSYLRNGIFLKFAHGNAAATRRVFSRRATHCANFIIREIRPRRRCRARRLRRIGGIAVSAVLNNERTRAAARSLPPPMRPSLFPTPLPYSYFNPHFYRDIRSRPAD